MKWFECTSTVTFRVSAETEEDAQVEANEFMEFVAGDDHEGVVDSVNYTIPQVVGEE